MSSPASSHSRSHTSFPSDASSELVIRHLVKSPRSQNAWRAIMQRYEARILAYAAKKMGPKLRARVSAEDVVADAWLRILRDFGDFEYRERGSLFAWLCKQVFRVIADYARALERHPEGASIDAARDDSSGSGIAIPEPDSGPSSQVSRRDLQEHLRRALDKVHAPYKEVLYAYHFEDKTRLEIAAELGRNPNTVSQQLKRGLVLWREAALGRPTGAD
jgi:RNA polymerase sigma factor (sigma-70 family)